MKLILCTIVQEKVHKQVCKTFSKNVERCRDDSAKTTETRCRDGSVQARQVIKGLLKQSHPYIIFFLPHDIDVPRIPIASKNMM